jgi:hypothetical protein
MPVKQKKARVPSKGPAMRVAVAKDVLFLLSKGLKATQGIYCSTYDGQTEEMFLVPDSPAQLQAAIPKMAKHCNVCAKGAIVLARIHLLNKV